MTGGHSQTKSAVRPLLPHADLQQPCIPLLWGPLCGVPISLPTSVLSSGLGTSLRPQQEPAGGDVPPPTYLPPTWRCMGRAARSLRKTPGKTGKHTGHSCGEDTEVAECQRALTYGHWGPFCPQTHRSPGSIDQGFPGLSPTALRLGVGSCSLRRGVIKFPQPLALGPLATPMGSLVLPQPSPPLQTLHPDVPRTSAHEVPQEPDPECPN